ncbi:hypothetical protein [Streptomyces sp. cg36]|uniref:hypothetical protein n=1 Tax=Streptomyces sp. cg36 TaxID=3238798 RepID=UPI0034E1C893
MTPTPPAPRGTGPDGAPARADLAAPLGGASLAASASGAALALLPLDSPLRAPLALYFLFAAPAQALHSALRRLQPLPRAVASLSGAVLINLLIAEIMASSNTRSIPGEIMAVAVISFLLFLAGTGVNHSINDRSGAVKIPKT